jgi:hypothetical protein
MPQSNFLVAVLQHTPVWVWVLLAVLLSLGVSQALPRTVTLRRITLLPLAMLALSLWSVISTFGSDQALAAWSVGALAASSAIVRAGTPRGALWSAADRVLHLRGSWVPLLLILGIFGTKFGVGVSLALDPSLRAADGFAIGASFAYGVFSGVFAGRALALWRVALRPMQAQPA